MYALSKVLVLLSVALSVTAFPSHFARNSHSHNDLVARVAPAEPVAKPVEVLEKRQALLERRLRKRSNSGRCAPARSSGLPASSSALSKVPPVSTPLPESSTSLYVPPHSSSTPLPDSSTSLYVPPHSSSTHTPQPSSSYVAPPQSSAASGGSGVAGALAALLKETFSGDGTYYAPGLGSCGITNSATDMIAAVSWEFYDSFPGYAGTNPNNNPVCGKTVSVSYGGKTIQVQITDRCTGCQYGALDFSPKAFNMLADPSIGRISGVSWHFV